VSAPVAVVGVGNPMRGDDGIGPAALRALAADVAPAGADLVQLDGEPARLIEVWRGRRRVVVVDAARTGAPPGTIHRLTLDDDLGATTAPASSHGAGVATAVALARRLDALPDELVVLGVEPADVAMGEGLSAPVAAALPGLVTRIRAEVAR